MNFKDYSFAQHGEVYAILEEVFTKHGINYYLVGANARDVQLYKAGIRPTRGTADIDFAVMMPDFDLYNQVFEELCNKGFRKADEQYRLYFEKSNTAIDLMPYGKIEQEYTVTFLDRNLTLHVLGFTEVGQKTELFTQEGFSVPVTPIEGILILKLVAWSDKPEWRIKDLEDISFLIKNGWDIYENEAYENHLDLFDENFDQMKAASRIIGRKMGPILILNTVLQNRIVSILENSIQDKARAQEPEITIAKNLKMSIDETLVLLKVILEGIKETAK
ncbi:nucleotidyl transferase AbiEii/AbiGii toxin family protein [Flavobacterium sp.]|uniref:nucleotidyl transferase AbiEii/AbiGii toxin family protein n=1 Tax=Flavobacterium sp. TaxID=239 RepID=UPI0039190612